MRPHLSLPNLTRNHSYCKSIWLPLKPLLLLLLLAGAPVILLSCIPYGLFGILVTICIYALSVYRDTAYQNICMGMIGSVLAIVIDGLLAGFLNMLFPLTFTNQRNFSFDVWLIRILLFYFITLLCDRLLKKRLLSGKSLYAFRRHGIWLMPRCCFF